MSKKIKEQKILEVALNKIVMHLQQKNINLKKVSKEERLNSAANEDVIIQYIVAYSQKDPYFSKNNLKIGTPNITNNREWYDFSIESDDTSIHNIFMPVNIKISDISKGGSDNLSCKMGIFYALTGCVPSSIMVNNKTGLSNEQDWGIFFKLIDEKMATNKKKDYYFLIINKADTSDIFWTSLRKLETITPNGNNLPFQCNWKKNRQRVHRSYIEAREFILVCFKSSIEKRIGIGTYWQLHMEKYVGLKTDRIQNKQSEIANDKQGV